jgi:hypothetical protein
MASCFSEVTAINFNISHASAQPYIRQTQEYSNPSFALSVLFSDEGNKVMPYLR